MSLQTPNRLHAAITSQFNIVTFEMQIIGSNNVRVDQLTQVENIGLQIAVFVPMVQPIIPSEAVVAASANEGARAIHVTPWPDTLGDGYDDVPDGSIVWDINGDFPITLITAHVYHVVSEPGPVIVSTPAG